MDRGSLRQRSRAAIVPPVVPDETTHRRRRITNIMRDALVGCSVFAAGLAMVAGVIWVGKLAVGLVLMLLGFR